MIVRYLDPLERLEFELIELRELGLPLPQEQAEFEKLKAAATGSENDGLRNRALEMLTHLASVPRPAAIQQHEPNDLAGIQAECSGHSDFPKPIPHDDRLLDALKGGWLGRAAGCLLGKPVERHPRSAIREILQANDQWPLDNYFTEKGMPAEILEKYPWKRRLGRESLRENIACMPEDDDLNYTMLNLHVLEQHGFQFTPADIGIAWLTKLPAYETFTAERVAYHNLLSGLEPPFSGRTLNPFREWIGAQIRADLWGYVCPGDPARAAELAWRDAVVSHTRNGVYGEMYWAAVLAAAFVESDCRALIETGLGFIPAKSRLAQAIQRVLEWPTDREWEDTLDQLETEFGKYHWVHTINNSALGAAALLSAESDFETAICNGVMGGWDTDSTGATIGSVMGVILGAQALPAKWTRPLQDRIRSSVSGFDNSRFSDLARRSYVQASAKRTDTGELHRSSQDDY